MPKNTISITTLKRNIPKEAHDYYIRHQTHWLIQELAKQRNRKIGPYLDELIEQVARLQLPPQEVERIIALGQQEEERRRQEAEDKHDELLAKRQQQKQKAVNQ